MKNLPPVDARHLVADICGGDDRDWRRRPKRREPGGGALATGSRRARSLADREEAGASGDHEANADADDQSALRSRGADRGSRNRIARARSAGRRAR